MNFVKYSNVKMVYRVMKSYLKARLLNKSAPISTLIDLTTRCPKGCVYCDSWKNPPEAMPTEKALNLLHELDEAGVSRITFHGGDPLMHPGFGKIIREARKLDFFITVSVRETLIKPKIKDLKFADLVFVSFDGNQKAHDFHKGKESFKDLMEAFQILYNNKINFQTTTVITNKNKDDIDFIIETARRFNFQAHFQPLQFPAFRKPDRSVAETPKNHPLIKLMLSKEEYVGVGRRLLQLKTKGNIATSKRIIKMMFLEWPHPAQTFLPYRLDPSIKCWAGLLYNSIASNGDLFSCSYYNPYTNKKRPNVFEIGVKKALKESIIEGNICKTCMMPCFMELNAMFSLNIPTILNWIPKAFKFIK